MKRDDHQLIQQVLDGELPRCEFDAFQQRLRQEPQLWALYEEYALLQHTLYEEFEGSHAIVAFPAGSSRKWRRAPAMVAAAAVIVLLVVLVITRPWHGRSAAPDVALLTFSVDARWEIEGSSRPIGGATGVASGTVLHLGCGRAGVSLSPSASGFVEGPAELVFRSAEEVYLRSGKAYFVVGCSDRERGFALETPRFTASDCSAEFGVEVPKSGREEVLVSDGQLRIVTRNDEVMSLHAGEAAQVPEGKGILRVPADDRHFAKALGRFRSVVSDSFDDGSLWATQGGAEEGVTHTRLLRLPQAVPGPNGAVVLATINLADPDRGCFSMGIRSEGSEVLCFEGNGVARDGQPVPVIRPDRDLRGMSSVTLRYDLRSGRVSLHEGGLPLGNPICSGTIAPGTDFDEIRLGASSAEALALNALDIRVGGE